MKVLRFTCSATLWLGVVCCSLLLSSQWAQAQSLWLGNDTIGNVFQTDTAGKVITDLGTLPVTGIAWDGSHLYFADPSGNFTIRNADGSPVDTSSFSIPSGDTGEDLAWDSKRKVLWRIVHAVPCEGGACPVLQEIDPAPLCEVGPCPPALVHSFPLSSSDQFLSPLGGLGVAYDSKRDLLYVSFCQQGCATLLAGVVKVVDPNTGNFITEGAVLFRTTDFATGGLGYDPDTDTLWVGDETKVRNMSLTGTVLSTFLRPPSGASGSFVDGLEFIPQSQSATITAGGQAAVLSFNGGTGNNAYDYTAQLLTHDGGLQSVTVKVQPILIDEESCEKLVDANPIFGHAQCFVFQNADGKGKISPVLFELTCPGLNAQDACDADSTGAKFFAELGTDFVFRKSDNPGFQLLNSTIGPHVGWLKGDRGVPSHPCARNPTNPNKLAFDSNQIESFSVTGDPTGSLKGGAKPGGSCWVGTYGTSGEAPPGVTITSPTFTIYNQNSTVTASYTCRTPKTSKDPSSSSTGPYLTVASCTQSQAPNKNNTAATCSGPTFLGGISCLNGGVDTSVKGFHVFQVKAVDTGGNVGVNFVIYFVR